MNLLSPAVKGKSYELWHGDSLQILPHLGRDVADAVITDPPYFKVKGDEWDNQWDKPKEFLAWLDLIVEQLTNNLKANGSLYLFASPQMSARVECLISERLNVLNCIRWNKEAGWHNKTKKDELRSYLAPWESIIFAEHYGTDNIAKGEAGYGAKCDELRGFVFEPLRLYLVGEFQRAGMLNTQGKISANVVCGFSASSGGMASRHYFSQSQWCLPTPEHYAALRQLLNSNGGQYLRREYEYLRREYEDLRREYEDLRRPFSVTAEVPYTDVWDFSTVQFYAGKHPCEKPQGLLRHAINSSTRNGATVLDCFAGTGSTGLACMETGRYFIGIEKDQKYFSQMAQRLEKRESQGMLEFV